MGRCPRVPSAPQLGEENGSELNAEEGELERSLILSLGGSSVVSGPLTDFEMTASSYPSFLFWSGRVYSIDQAAAFQVPSSFR